MPPESDKPGNEPNLELPSLGLGFGRKKKRGKTADVATSDAGDAGAPDEDEALADGEVIAPPPDAAADAATGPAPAPARPTAPRAPARPAAPPAPARAPGAGPTPPRPAARPPARPPSRPAAATPPQVAPTPPVAAPKPAPARPPVTPPAGAQPPADVEPTTVLDRADTAPRTAIEPTPDPLSTAAAALDEPAQRRSRRGKRDGKPREKSREKSRRDRPAKVKRERPAPAEALVATLPPISPILASLVTGALSGLGAVALAVAASRGCEAVRDTSGCGGGLGLLALVAILAIEVVIGASLLKAWKIPDPFSTSFLGVGIVATVAMLTFLDSLDSVWMFLVIPVITGATFVLSWWTTVRFIGEYDADARRVATADTTDEDDLPEETAPEDERSDA